MDMLNRRYFPGGLACPSSYLFLSVDQTPAVSGTERVGEDEFTNPHEVPDMCGTGSSPYLKPHRGQPSGELEGGDRGMAARDMVATTLITFPSGYRNVKTVGSR